MTRLLNVGKDRIKDIPEDAPIVSIGDVYSSPINIPNAANRPLLVLSFFPGDHFHNDVAADRLFTKDKGEQLVAFCEEHRKAGVEAIYIQCGEGRIRSYTLCTVLSSIEGYRHDHANSSFQRGIIDLKTAHVLGSVVDALNQEQ